MRVDHTCSKPTTVSAPFTLAGFAAATTQGARPTNDPGFDLPALHDGLGY